MKTKQRAARFLCVLLAAGLAFGGMQAPAASASASAPAASTGMTINVYNWGEYISDGTDDSLDVNKAFTERTGIQVNYTTYDSNESLYSKLAGGGADYDVIIPSDYMIAKLIKEKLVQKLDFSNIPNASYIDAKFRDPVYDPQNAYSVPYMWGVVGIFYNKKYVKDPVDSWNILWDTKYKGKILMFDNPRDAFGIAQKLLGYSYNSTDPKEWENAAELLKKQKPLVQAYVMDQIFDKMENGEAWVAPYYAGDAATLVKENKDIGFSIPTKEGTNFFVDAICIPSNARHKKEAEAYINFLADPEVAAANSEYIGYSTPESAAKALLPEDIANNPIYYPDESTLANAETFTNLPDDTNLLVDTLWAEVKMGGTGSTATLVAVLLAFFALYIGIIVYKKIRRKREMQ